jgi:Flp pilus assembly protein TadD
MPEKGQAVELTPHQAIEHYEREVKEEPNDAGRLMGLGAAYYIAHRWDEAIAPLEKAVSLRPDLGHAHYYLGVLYAARGDKDRAQKELEAVIKVGNNPILVAQAKSRIPSVHSPAELAANS